MGALSNYLEEKILNDYFVNDTVYVALFTSDPTDLDSGTEVIGGSYERQVTPFSAPIQNEGDQAEIVNTAEVKFPIATADWGEVGHFGVYDAETNGNLLAHGALITPKAIETNDQITFYAGNLKIKLD